MPDAPKPELFDAIYPESIAQYEYFLKEFAGPGWQWGIRGVLAGCFVVALLVHRHYKKKNAQ